MLTFALTHMRTVLPTILFLVAAFWIELIALLLRPDWRKLHLLWVVPVTLFAMTLVAYTPGGRAASKKFDNNVAAGHTDPDAE